MNISIILLLAFSLSMDAFSLSLAYGTLNFESKMKKRLSLSVGIFHFIMPILGMSVKYYLKDFFHISLDIITFVIFVYIGMTMIINKDTENKIEFDMYLKNILLFSIAVSLDSFTVGLALNDFILLAPLIFSLFSMIFTYLGLNIGERLHKKYGRMATILGGIIFIVLGFIYL